MRAYVGYPEYQGFFFSRVTGILGVGRRHRPRAAKPWEKRAEQYKDVTDTENRTKEVSGAQSIVGLNHSQLKSHFEQRDFKFRGTLWHLTIIWISQIRTANKCTDDPAVLVTFTVFFVAIAWIWGVSGERGNLSAPFSVPPLHSKISSPLTPKEGHSHF